LTIHSPFFNNEEAPRRRSPNFLDAEFNDHFDFEREDMDDFDEDNFNDFPLHFAQLGGLILYMFFSFEFSFLQALLKDLLKNLM